MESFKILHLTYIEGFIPIIPLDVLNGLDFVLLSGDISIGAKNLGKVAKSFKKIAQMLPDSLPIYYIPGNREYPEVAAEFEGMPPNFIPLHAKYTVIKKGENSRTKIFVIGFGGAIPGILNHFAKTEEEFMDGLTILFEKVLSEITPKAKVILMVHNPPYGGKLDFAMTTRKHIGSKSISSIISLYKPDLCVCGHVHESSGIEHIGNTICVNPGASKHGNATLITISEDAIDAEIIKIEATRRLKEPEK